MLLLDRGLLAGEIKPGLDHRVGVERNAFDFLIDQPAGEIGVIGRALPADPDILTGVAAGFDGHGKQGLDRGIAFIEGSGDQP